MPSLDRRRSPIGCAIRARRSCFAVLSGLAFLAIFGSSSPAGAQDIEEPGELASVWLEVRDRGGRLPKDLAATDFVVREAGRIYSLFARCTHLGCTVNWFEELNIFKCPCHGSEFHSNGVEFAGPAPRPLDRHHIAVDNGGNIIVDTARVYSKDEFEDQKIFIEVG